MSKATIAETSLMAFQDKKQELSEDQEKVFEALKEIGPVIGEEIAQHLGVPYHTISGRFGELQDQNQIKKKGMKQNPRGNMAQIWKVKQ